MRGEGGFIRGTSLAVTRGAGSRRRVCFERAVPCVGFVPIGVAFVEPAPFDTRSV
jgi:hypothetical protein